MHVKSLLYLFHKGNFNSTSVSLLLQKFWFTMESLPFQKVNLNKKQTFRQVNFTQRKFTLQKSLPSVEVRFRKG